MKATSPQFVIAVREYRSGRFTNQALAARHGMSLSTIANWIRRSGAPRKPRGRRPLDEPNAINRQIIELAAELSGREIARRFGVSPQRIQQVLKRWEHLRPQRTQRPINSVAAPAPRKRRELRSRIVSFRLTALQTDGVRATVMAWGFGNRLSNGAACRAVLLAAIGIGKINLQHTGPDPRVIL